MPKGIKGMSDEARFWGFVARRGPDECWLWTGANTYRYGVFTFNKKQVGAHRFSYQLAHGSIPEGMQVLHSCDIGLCVNPSHLRVGTHADNMADKVLRGRCPRGEMSGPSIHRDRMARGERNGSAKLNSWDVRFIRHWSKLGHPSRYLANIFGVNKSVILGIRRGTIWSHV